MMRNFGVPHSFFPVLIVAVFMLILPDAGQAQYKQDLWKGSEFIESPDGTYQVNLEMPDTDLMTIAQSLQKRKKKYQVEGDRALINMTYVVYEKAMIGTRAFGRIRYNIEMERVDDRLLCTFRDFSFRKIERDPRYGKLEEVGGKPKDMATAKSFLSEQQWSIIRWKTEGVVERKIAHIDSLGLPAASMED